MILPPAYGSGDPKDYFAKVANGEVIGSTMWNAMGEFEGGTVVAAGVDVTRSQDFSPVGPDRLYTPDSAGEQFTVISEHAGDDSVGIGIQTLRLYYIDAAGAEQTEDIIMDGLTGVDTDATDIRFINDMHALSVGTNGVSMGNIGVYVKGSTIPLTLTQMIALGGNKSLVPHRMVPLGKKLILKSWRASEAQSKRCVFRIRSTDMYGVVVPGVFCFKDTIYLNGTISPDVSLNQIIPALSILKVTYWADAIGAEGSSSWWGELRDNV
jgi:hypothetical protein